MWFHLSDKFGEKNPIANSLILRLDLGFGSKMKFNGSHFERVSSMHRLHKIFPSFIVKNTPQNHFRTSIFSLDSMYKILYLLIK